MEYIQKGLSKVEHCKNLLHPVGVRKYLQTSVVLSYMKRFPYGGFLKLGTPKSSILDWDVPL